VLPFQVPYRLSPLVHMNSAESDGFKYQSGEHIVHDHQAGGGHGHPDIAGRAIDIIASL
jgi:hypothetical protein